MTRTGTYVIFKIINCRIRIRATGIYYPYMRRYFHLSLKSQTCFSFFFLDQERRETEQKVHEAMEAALACGSGGQPQLTASRQSEAAQKSLKRAGAPSDQGRNMMNTA